MYSNFSFIVKRRMGKGGAGWTLFLDVTGLLCCTAMRKMSFREVTWKKIILRLPVSKNQITPNFLLGAKSAGLWQSFAQVCLTPQEGPPSPPLHLHTHTCGASMDQSPQHLFSAAPQPDPTRNTGLTFVKHTSWCDARPLTRYQTQIAIQGKFFWSFPEVFPFCK